ncbi:MAG: sugar O-acetyltransferase [candidate division KSB1 bacterium]|nr:sugar O-acetyltransferase [candidate division KSB1 bacterium]
MTQKERMLAELPYKAWLDGLAEERLRTNRKIYKYNHCKPQQMRKKKKLVRRILGKAGEPVTIEAPFYCDYGYNIEIGDDFFANFNLVILDVARVRIGSHVQCGPHVSIITAGHPVHYKSRNSGYEYGIPVTIGNNVWLGSNCVINPGVRIGDNSVIGAGAVVTRDMPDNVIAAGVPCSVLRTITEQERPYYFKDRVFDVSDF